MYPKDELLPLLRPVKLKETLQIAVKDIVRELHEEGAPQAIGYSFNTTKYNTKVEAGELTKPNCFDGKWHYFFAFDDRKFYKLFEF